MLRGDGTTTFGRLTDRCRYRSFSIATDASDYGRPVGHDNDPARTADTKAHRRTTESSSPRTTRTSCGSS
jgi:hypothetical protein